MTVVAKVLDWDCQSLFLVLSCRRVNGRLGLIAPFHEPSR